MWTCVLGVLFVIQGATPGPRYSSRIVETQSGQIRGIIQELPVPHLEPVECFLGVPYATPPVGNLRLRPPRPPLPWSGTRLADTQPHACPQRSPLSANATVALLSMPRDRYQHLRRLVPLLRNQSEDCLTLNVYVPASGSRGEEAPYAIMVYIHGESYEWGASHVYDVSVWASQGHVIAVTINYRLGLLGFLKTHSGAKSCCFALRDIEAALVWIQTNIVSFGGDPRRVTLVGHDTGAALVNSLLLADTAAGLFHRVILLSGSILCPWAVASKPDSTARQVGALLGCPSDTDLAECLRRAPLSKILTLDLQAPRFLSVYGPWFATDPQTSLDRAGDSFISRPVMVGVVSTESYLDLNSHQVQLGFEEDQRNRILRTFIRNTYLYHLNELFSTVRNEYTDWDKPIIHPINLRDSTLEALSDGHTVSPMVHLTVLHSRRGSTTFLLHFNHQTRETDYIQRLGSLRGEDLPYVLGVPLVGGLPLYPGNYTRADAAVSETILSFVTNFAKTGNPNEPKFERNEFGVLKEKDVHKGLTWEQYNPNSQLYLSLGPKPRMRSHYRGHKMSVWLNLLPQLHRPGDRDVAMRHHYFFQRNNTHYDGIVRPEVVTRISLPPSTSPLLPTEDCDNSSTVEQDGEPQPSTEEQGTPRKSSTHQGRGLLATVAAGGLLAALNLAVLVATVCRARRRVSRPNPHDLLQLHSPEIDLTCPSPHRRVHLEDEISV
ncbi:neuroligin-1-like [Homalodisca vitripennis]|uniref:neuroligin-1-like n=1 Tax=Homalodisca vitripennis TaxID=197043 RepID=UPI001EEC2CCB|nr:neuroligin-1-like [Homalodisca vitripennis]KAG8275527.1 neurexin protein binding [Homalodisca vitripennis]